MVKGIVRKEETEVLEQRSVCLRQVGLSRSCSFHDHSSTLPSLEFPLPELRKQLREPKVIFEVNHFPKYQTSTRSQWFYRIAGAFGERFP